MVKQKAQAESRMKTCKCIGTLKKKNTGVSRNAIWLGSRNKGHNDKTIIASWGFGQRFLQ
ncbi:hypothetical protein HMPREF9442_01169 [Paraprevotella xylaniphila YIT 11841]|uniref:Uncharacterized protein n=1 Tax=Paraprevotella xylaniphila YIT 11841 TaxID=762982 RepID=F3QSK9_9BACT|nr:hypothetical protein HMPREF9442_01169 [Paraprevotella xylaniphila YIT 11841]